MKNHTDDLFLQQLKEATQQLIIDDNLGINQLCTSMAMSRSQMHRKVKALTGYSTSIHIRNIKLEKAKTLLLQSDKNIADVARECGIKSPQNMSKYFQLTYGMSPTQYRNLELKQSRSDHPAQNFGQPSFGLPSP